MKKGKYQKTGSKKTLALVLVLVLLLGLTVGGTLAWLTAKTDAVVNTFTTSDINVTLTETTGNTYKMIPGYDITKDPKASITAGSEAAWLFVKVEKSKNFDTYMTYEMADGWTEVETGVYARKVETAHIVTAYSVLKGDKVTVLGTVTKEMMNSLTEDTYPTLTFTAYASQLMKNATTEFTAAEAWANIK